MRSEFGSTRKGAQAAVLQRALLAEAQHRANFLALELKAFIHLMKQACKAIADEDGPDCRVTPEEVVSLIVHFSDPDLYPSLTWLSRFLDMESQQ